MTDPVVLPEAVRRRVVDLAAQRLGELPADEVPPSLRPFVRFAPQKRAALAALPLAAAVEDDEGFRASVASQLRAAFPEVVAAIEQKRGLPAADPVDVATLAYLLRPEGWPVLVEPARAAEEAAAAHRRREREEREERRASARAAATSSRAREHAAATDDAVRRLTAELAAERTRAREALGRVRRAEQQAAAAAEERDDVIAASERAVADAAARAERLRAEVDELRAELERTRTERRDARAAADARVWLLLDTVTRATSGLRDALGVAPPSRRPADVVAEDLGALAVDGPVRRPALVGDDPGHLEELLRLPAAHLVVDGYNVTKSAYGGMPLAEQRQRLVASLVPLAARTRAEVTVVFDGADVVGVPAQSGRGVRVLYSPAGVTADEVIRRLARAEPPGRVLVVCSADREVVDGVRAAGAHTVAPVALLARLR